MAQQHIENLFRRSKGQLVNIKSISGTVYKGRVGEISNDHVLLTDSETEQETQTFVLYVAIESVVLIKAAAD